MNTLAKTLALLVAILAAGTLVTFAEETPPPARLTDDVAQDVVRSIQDQVAELRGLEFRREVPVAVVSEEAVRDYFVARMKLFDQDEQIRDTGRVYELLGLIPEGVRLEDLIAQALEQQAGGYYDPSSGGYFLVETVPAAAAPIFTAHELTHALEDQHYDLDRRLREVLDNDDAMFARSAVHEGSATALMTSWAAQAAASGQLTPASLMALMEKQKEQQSQIDAMPPVLMRQLLGPYMLGAGFLARGGPALGVAFPGEAVEQAYRDGPTSSEQIIHPERFWDAERRDQPRSVEIQDMKPIVGRGWTRRSTGVLGELTLGLLVGAQTPKDPLGLMDGSRWTNDAASGWGGDRWELWTRRKSAVVVLSTEWDTAEDAVEFEQALAQDASWHVGRSGARVAIVAGSNAGRAAELLAALLAESAPHP